MPVVDAFTVAVCVALIGVSVADVASGADGRSPAKTIPTLPPATNDSPVSIVTSTVAGSIVPASSGPPSTAEAVVETGIPIRAGASIAELFAAADRVFASNGDVVAGLGRFAVVPDGIPTPSGALIRSFTVQYLSRSSSYTASSQFTTTATADDVITFYETTLTAAGFALTVDDAQVEHQRLGFGIPGSDDERASVSVSVDSRNGVVIDLQVSDHLDADVLQAFSGWPAGMPTIGEGRPVDARVSATRGSETTLIVSTTFAYDGVGPEELTARVRDALANGGGGFRVAESDDGSSTIALVHAVIESPSAEISSDFDDVTVLEMRGSVTID